jgi:hypothetical protein
MKLQLLAVALIVAGGFLSMPQGRADEEDKPDLKPLVAKIRELLEKHYPKAEVTLDGDTIRFEFNLRKFMIHEPLLTGEWQDAHEELGPQKGGIFCNIELREGQYGGMAAVPQSFDKRYFVLFMTASYSKKLDHHLMIHLKYPRDAKKEFVKDFSRLMDEFDKHVAPAKK